MAKIIFEGPNDVWPINHAKYGLVVFPREVEVECEEDLAAELVAWTERQKADRPWVNLDTPAGVKLAEKGYGMKFFRRAGSSGAFNESPISVGKGK